MVDEAEAGMFVYAMDCKLLQSEKVQFVNGVKEFKTSLPNGVYTVELVVEGAKRTLRLVICR